MKNNRLYFSNWWKYNDKQIFKIIILSINLNYFTHPDTYFKKDISITIFNFIICFKYIKR